MTEKQARVIILQIVIVLFKLIISLGDAANIKIPVTHFDAGSQSHSKASFDMKNNYNGMDSEYGLGEPATVKFLTKVRVKRNTNTTITKDYHIVQIDLPQSNTSFRVHLVKSNEAVSSKLTLAIKEGNSTVTILENESNSASCLYMGTATMVESNKTSDMKNQKKVHGSSSISLCGYTNSVYHSELNGLIIAGNEHFVLQPPAESQYINITETLPHTVFRSSKINAERKHDVIRVPKKELEKAIEEMKAKNEEKIIQSGNFVSPGGTNTTRDETESMDEELYDDYDNGSNGFEDFDMPIQTLKIIPKTKKAKKQKAKTITKSKNKVIEIAVFTDAALYKKLKMKTSKETIQRIKNVALATVNNMNLLYKQSSLGVQLKFRLIHLEIIKSNPKKLNTNRGRASKYLSSFCKYAGDKNTDGDLWDHALMLTGLDIIEDGDKLVAGLAWAGTMCLRYWSCSLSEGYSFGSVFIVSHEIGHSLGMEHDGYGPSLKCNPNLYLMSATTGPGKVQWSSCSSSNVKQFIKTGNPEIGKKDPGNRPKCLNRNSPIAKKSVKYDAGKLPGQIYNANKQCRLECGASCTPYVKNYYPYNNVCAMLFCQKPASKKKKLVQQAHPALEGTKCDTGKYCRGGSCVATPGNPKKLQSSSATVENFNSTTTSSVKT